MARGRVSVQIFGTSFEIQADERSDYLQQLYNKYTAVVEEVRSTSGLDDPLKISVVAGILLADELEKNSNRHEEKSEENLNIEQLDMSTERMIAALDEAIDEAL